MQVPFTWFHNPKKSLETKKMFCLAHPKNDLCATKKCHWQNPKTGNIHSAFTLQKYWKLNQDTYISFTIKQGAGSLYYSFVWYRMGRVGNFFLGLKKRVGKYALQEGVSHFPGLGLHTA